MNRALVSFGVGDFAELLEISRPGLEAYADRHGYELHTRSPSMLLRPASWHKITSLLDLLEDYDEAVWVDCDCVIMEPGWDIADEVPDWAWHAITRHHTPEGEVPSCGVWYLRQPMQPVLEAIWRLTRYLNHRWWEQAALQQLLGYTPEHLPVHQDHQTELSDRTYWLDVEWNALAFPDRIPEPGTRIAHCAPGHPVWRRADLMRQLAAATERSTIR
jgi:glycosyl transferase family (putative galactosyltransferase)